MHSRKPEKLERGAVLITALIFLGVITILSVTSMRSSTIGIRLAQNEEARFASLEVAQAMTEIVAADPRTTPIVGGAGYSFCTAGEAGCNSYGVPLPAGYVADQVAAGNLNVRIERMTPPDKPPPRVLESSIDSFRAASFRVVADYDRSDEGLGRARLVEGLIVLVPSN
ncbi:MAG: hypothetical protein JXB36_11485 [Gammaproteobacteria bacterium]|nr:hypothetical protein [Gammaproteobacteria bacterium]